MQEFALQLLKAVVIQISSILGIFFVFGIILSKLQEWTHKKYLKAIGWKGILITAWLGTPIHELGHAFFAKIFRHKVTQLSLFKPNQETGGLGYVNHTFNPNSLYQKVGNFFIGSAPLIFGGTILSLLLYFLVPNGKQIFQPLLGDSTSIQSFFDSLIATFKQLFTLGNITSYRFWIFIVLSFCISSHVAPSKQDRKGMWKGFFWIVLLFVIVNACLLFLRFDVTSYVVHVSQYIGIISAVFLFTMIMSLLHLILASILFGPIIRHKRLKGQVS